MRKSLTLTLLLLILAVGSFGYIHASVDKSKDAVTIDETILYGDKSIAEGIAVDLSTHCDYRLFWDTRYTIKRNPEIGTTFTFSQAQRQPEQPKAPCGFYLDNMLGGWGASGNLNMKETFPLHPVRAMATLPVRDVATRTKTGEEHTETVFVKDYYDFYPISVGFQRPSRFTTNEDTLNLFADYFRIPVYPKHQVKISIGKDAAGNVNSISLSPIQDTEAYFYTPSIITDNNCFFAFSCYTKDGELLDTSHIPGGYGIYRFQLHNQDGDNCIFTANELQTVFSLDAERVRVAALHTSKDQSKLLLVTEEDAAYMLTVIDAATMTELQKLRIMDADIEAEPWRPRFRNLYIYEDFIVAISGDNRFTLLTLNSVGNYEVRFEASFAEIERLKYIFSSELAMDYNGEELVVAAFQDAYYQPRNNCSFYLAVYTNMGLAYAGHYQHSLDKSLIDHYPLICRPLEGAPLRVTWGD